MSKCWCRFGMAVLIILFAWLPFSWNKIVISVLGVMLAGAALTGTCCCAARAEAKDKQAETSPTTAE